MLSPQLYEVILPKRLAASPDKLKIFNFVVDRGFSKHKQNHRF
jgi:hypothetical protein